MRVFPRLPIEVDRVMGEWCRAVELEFSRLPFSVISTNGGPNVIGIVGDRGLIAVDIASSATTRLWQKRSGSTLTTGWSAISWI